MLEAEEARRRAYGINMAAQEKAREKAEAAQQKRLEKIYSKFGIRPNEVPPIDSRFQRDPASRFDPPPRPHHNEDMEDIDIDQHEEEEEEEESHRRRSRFIDDEAEEADDDEED